MANEFRWGTVRQMVINDISRRDLILAKLGAVVILSLSFAVVQTLIGFVGSGIILGWHPDGAVSGALLVGSLAAQLLGVASLGVLWGFATRSPEATVAAIGGYFLLEPLGTSLIAGDHVGRWLMNHLPVGLLLRTTRSPAPMGVLTDMAPPPLAHWAWVCGYVLLFWIASWVLFRRADL